MRMIHCSCGHDFEPVVQYRHKLVCGDCTDKAVVERVMDGERAELALADPPYNVGLDYDVATPDDMTGAAYESFSRRWMALADVVSKRQIVTPGCNNLASWLRWFEPYHWSPWIKTNSMTNGLVSRFWCWEPVVWFGTTWEPILWFGKRWGRRRANDVFNYPIGQQSNVANHPCPKPLKMWLDIVTNFTKAEVTIYDPFLGSGTTMVACQNLGRKCRGIEISPGYVAVALQRMQDAFGITGTRVNSDA